METFNILQHYWWALISLLGAILVFLMFVQGGQSLLFGTARNESDRTLILNTFGHKWELTFTTLVTFGGAAFAAYPLFYSTSFGGAFWLWMSILLLFVLQAVSYEYRGKIGNLLGARTYEIFLFLNGTLGCLLLGVAVGMFFTGGDFTIDKMNITNASSPIISEWAHPARGMEAIFVPFNLLLGIGVFLAARTLGLLYAITYIDEPNFVKRCRGELKITGTVFVLGFVAILIFLSLLTGLQANADGTFTPVAHKFFFNFVELGWPIAVLLIGVIGVLVGLIRSFLGKEKYNFYFTGIGVILAVWPLLICAGFNDTAYFASTVSPEDSLSLANSSSSQFTLTVMTYASLAIPFVIAYIVYVWRALTRKKISTQTLQSKESETY
ncbi:MAG: cytochrome d ubiquinol oxidase subunit II [Parabacteroides sp.]|nr:cytochrome d ubiquinol oxidase subunit II [Parabacteroides sp.]